MNLDAAQQRQLLELGRQSIEFGLREQCLAPWPGPAIDAELQSERASFTTLTIGAELRGCCGSIDPARSLAEDVWRNAWASAFSDPRFAPLERHEYPQLDLKISVLSPLEPVLVPGERELLDVLRPGTDGLVLELGVQRVTFLPTVWDQLPDPRAFLRHLKQKAGWSAEFWSERLRVYRYTTQSFGAGEP